MCQGMYVSRDTPFDDENSTHLPGLKDFTAYIQPLQASHEARVQQHIVALSNV